MQSKVGQCHGTRLGSEAGLAEHSRKVRCLGQRATVQQGCPAGSDTFLAPYVPRFDHDWFAPFILDV